VSSRKAAGWVALFIALAIAGGVLDPWDGGDGRDRDRDLGTQATAGKVVRVVDGDTVKVRLGESTETVRYIGVDTPETVKPGEPVQCFGKRASDFNRRTVAGRRVRLRFGAERRDRYGRLLAFVYVEGGGRSVNAELIARGYGRVLTIPPNDAQADAYERLERRARRGSVGIWGTCPI
jgi:micrococcal nuclease